MSVKCSQKTFAKHETVEQKHFHKVCKVVFPLPSHARFSRFICTDRVLPQSSIFNNGQSRDTTHHMMRHDVTSLVNVVMLIPALSR